VVVPFELVKIKSEFSFIINEKQKTKCEYDRLQDKTSKYAGPMDVVKQIVRKNGFLGLYSGMESTFWRYVTHPPVCISFMLISFFLKVIWFGMVVISVLFLPLGNICLLRRYVLCVIFILTPHFD